MKTVGIVTSTRAEYGLLKGVMEKFLVEPTVQTKIIVTGMHLSKQYGKTVDEINGDCIPIYKEISILEKNRSNESVSNIMAYVLEKFSDYFRSEQLDILVLLGDRYEIFAVAIAAMNAKIPIAHIHGGEVTEGALDDAMRHGITKLSYLHFVSTEEYRKRVIQLGEHPNRVFNVGALGVENCKKQVLMSKNELEESIQFTLGDAYAVFTYHPVTLQSNDIVEEIQVVVQALIECTDMKYLCTKANADEGGNKINEYLEEIAIRYPTQFKLVDSLGMKRYLSALKYCTMVIGNSSSGILEAPAMQVPTVNIGHRQRGRIQANSVFNCEHNIRSIQHAMEEAKNWTIHGTQFLDNPYDKKNTAKNIVRTIVGQLNDGNIDLKKEFYNMEGSL